jgi:putative DNA primase/helicase
MLDECLLPEGLRRWLVDISQRAQAPLDFAAAAAIVALSSALGRRLCIQPKRQDDWLVVPNLWGLIIGPPGYLKSPITHEIMKPLMRLEARVCKEYDQAAVEYEVQKQVFDAKRNKLVRKFSIRDLRHDDRDELASQLRELYAAPPTRRRYLVNDPTVEKLGEILNQNPSGVLLFRDEIAGFLASMDRQGHENDRAFYLEAWNGVNGYVYDRISRGTLRVEAACVSILGTITPGPLSRYLREAFSGERDDGLMQRFQVSVYPDPPRTWNNVDRFPDHDAQQRAAEIFERIVTLTTGFVSSGSGTSVQTIQGIPTLRFDDAAQELFNEYREHLGRRIRSADEHPVMIAHLSKFRSLMPSLALIFHVVDSFENHVFPPVGLESTKLAAAWCDYLEQHARRIYHPVMARVDLAARLLGEKIKAGKLVSPFTAKEVYRQQWTGLSESLEVSDALELLERLAWVVSELHGPSPEGGRPSRRYHINPQVRMKL